MVIRLAWGISVSIVISKGQQRETHLNQSINMKNNCREQKRPGAKQRVTMAAEFCSRFLLDRNSVRSRLASNSQSDASLLSTGIISMHHHAQLESFLILVHVNESSWLIYSAGITLRELWLKARLIFPHTNPKMNIGWSITRWLFGGLGSLAPPPRSFPVFI